MRLEYELKSCAIFVELFSSVPLTGELQTYKTFFKWSLVTFISSTAPCLYTAWAGRGTFPKEARFVFILIFIFFLSI